MKTMSKLLALIVAVAMVLSLMPTAVFAAEESAADASAAVSQEENEGKQEEAPEETDGQASDDAAWEAEEEKPSDDAPEAEEEPSGEDTRGEVQTQDGTTTNVALLNGTEYSTLEAAIKEANGNTVKLLTDVELTQSVTIASGKTVTIDLNGKTIDGVGTSEKRLDPVIVNNGTLTIQDTASGGKIRGRSCIKTATGSRLTIESGILEGEDGCIWTGNANHYNVTINGGTLSATQNAVLMGNGNSGNGADSTWTINGGTFNGSMDAGGIELNYIACGIYAPDAAAWTINGGTFNITNGVGILSRAGSVNIPGTSTVQITTTGNIIGMVGDSRVVVRCAALVFDSTANYPCKTNSDQIAVAAGTFVSGSGDAVQFVNEDNDNNKRIVISGGFFSSDPSTYLADGCQAQNSSGSWTVGQPLHTFNYSKPDVRWRVINGEMKAIFIYSCSYCDETQTEIVSPISSDSDTKRTYTATDAHDNTETLEKSRTYTVTATIDATTKTETHAWGEKCTLTANSAKAWYIDSVSDANLVADGTNTYIFAVTNNVTIVTGDPIQSTPQAVVRATLTSDKNNEAAFNAKWSIPTGTSVDSVTIYRGYTGTDSTVSESTIISKGKQHNVNLLVWNGDYTLHLTDLTKKYQYAMIEIVYTDSSGLRQTLRSAVKKIQVTGVSN